MPLGQFSTIACRIVNSASLSRGSTVILSLLCREMQIVEKLHGETSARARDVSLPMMLKDKKNYYHQLNPRKHSLVKRLTVEGLDL